jgi:hypothetical protein
MLIQMIRALRGLTSGTNVLDEGDYTEEAALGWALETKFWSGLIWYGACRAGIHVVFRDFRAAVGASKVSEDALGYDVGFWSSPPPLFLSVACTRGRVCRDAFWRAGHR